MNDPCKHETKGGPEFCVRCLREVGDRRHLVISEMLSALTDEKCTLTAIAKAIHVGRSEIDETGDPLGDSATVKRLDEEAKRLKKRVDDLDQFMMHLSSAVEKWRDA